MLQGQRTRINVRTILWPAFLLVVGGIIGNRADAAFLQLWRVFTQTIIVDWWPWVITGSALLVSFTIFWTLLNSKANSTIKQREANSLFNLDRLLDALLPTAISIQDPERGLHDFIQQAFEIVSRNTLGDMRRGLLLLPDAKGEILTVSDIHGWLDRDGKIQKRFCIDSQNVNLARGIAGEAFIRRRIILAHVTVENRQVKCDEAAYIPSQDIIFPFHGSLVCVPILTGEESDDCLGILCFDSYNLTAFDAPITKDVLFLLARHIAVVLLIRQKIVNSVMQLQTV